MEEKIYIDALTNALGQTIELSPEHNALISLDDADLFIQWRSRMQVFQVQMAIGKPNPIGGGIFKKLLSANFLLYQTGGASLSYNEELDMVFLENIISIQGIDGNEFVEQIEIFVQIRDAWVEKLNSLNEENQNIMINEFVDLENEIMNEEHTNMIKV